MSDSVSGRRRHADAPVVSHVQPTRLRHTCATAAAQGVDLAVIDTPARTEAAALEAARVADLVVIPCRPQIYDVETIPATQQLLALTGHPSAVVILNAVPSRGQRRVEQVRTAVASLRLTGLSVHRGRARSPATATRSPAVA